MRICFVLANVILVDLVEICQNTRAYTQFVYFDVYQDSNVLILSL